MAYDVYSRDPSNHSADETQGIPLEDPLGEPLRRQPRPYVWLERLLLLAFTFCLLVGLTAFGIWWTLRTPTQPPLGGDPLAAVRNDQILPQLALRQLGGAAPDGLSSQAIQAGELETARALLAYDTELDPIAHAGRLAQLGRAFQERGEQAVAAQVYRLMLPSAVLNLTMSPLERAQLLVQAAKGMAAAGQLPGARSAAAQAQLIITQTPDLLPAQRSQIYAELQDFASVLQDPAFAAKIDDLARNPFLSPQGVLIPHRMATFHERLPYDAAVEAAMAARTQAATLLADRIGLTGGIDIDPERQALAAALLAEDQARSLFYQGARDGAVSLPQQTWLLADRITWLSHKLRVASGGYGISILPEWEGRRGELLAELGGAFNDYAAALDAAAAALPTTADQALQRVENQMWLAQQAERGLFAAIGLNDMSERLRIVQDDVVRQLGPLALPVAYEPDAAPPGFRIQPNR
jgi:hypothetical protein